MKMQHFCGIEYACMVHVNPVNSNTYKNTKKKRTVLIEHFGKKTGIFTPPDLIHFQITTDRMIWCGQLGRIMRACRSMVEHIRLGGKSQK